MSCKKQTGFVVIFVCVFMSALLLVAAQFHRYSYQHMLNSGFTRTGFEAEILAESALNLMMGEFLSGRDYFVNGIADIEEARSLVLLQNDPVQMDRLLDTLPYMMYIKLNGALDEITLTQPQLLQSLANGAGQGSTQGNANYDRHYFYADNDQALVLDIADLFSDKRRPVLLVQDQDTGLLRRSDVQHWGNESSDIKLAAWMELVRSSGAPEDVDIYVQVFAEVHGTRRYTQRHLLTVPANRYLGDMSLITESRP